MRFLPFLLIFINFTLLSQKNNSDLISDFFENLNVNDLYSKQVKAISINTKMDTTIRYFARNVPFEWYGFTNWNQTYYDSLIPLRTMPIKISEKSKYRIIAKKQEVPLKCFGSRLRICRPVKYQERIFVHFLIDELNENYSSFTLIWVAIYDQNWNFIELKSGYSVK